MAALISTILVTLIAFGPLPSALHHPDAEPPTEVADTPLTSTQTATVAQARELFADADLELPVDLVVRFPSDPAGCDGDLGRYEVVDGQPTASVCWTHHDPEVERRLQLQALVHEFAHAWEDAVVDDPTREAFEQASGATSWAHGDSAWTDRGQELAAELITWALLDPAVLFIDFGEMGTCTRWAHAFSLLTGQSAPEPLVRECDPGR